MIKILLVDDEPDEHENANDWARKMTPIIWAAENQPSIMKKINDVMTEAFSKQMSEEGPEKVSNNLEELLNEAREFYSNQASANSTIVTPQEEKIF